MARFAPKSAKRKAPLTPRSILAIWVGAHEATTGNVFIFESGKIVRVRIVFGRPGEARRIVEHVARARATLICPNRCNFDESITILRPDEGDHSKFGRDLPDTPAQPSAAKARNFKMTKKLFEEHGLIPSCVGCGALQEGASIRNHSTFCRTKISEEFMKTEGGKHIVKNFEVRLDAHQPDIVEAVPIADAIVEPTTDEDDETEEDEDVDDGVAYNVLAWMNNITEGGCSSDEVREMLKKFDPGIVLEDYISKSHAKDTNNDASEIDSSTQGCITNCPPCVDTRFFNGFDRHDS